MSNNIAYPASFNLQLTISRECWNDLLVADNQVVLKSVVATARQTLDNAGEFLIQGNSQDEAFNTRVDFEKFLRGLNDLRSARGQSALGQ